MENIVKHEPANKTNIRSATTLNIKNIPAKSTLKREHKTLYSTNPLRLGEMETSGLLIAKDAKKLEKLLKAYSTNQDMRQEMVKKLIKPGLDEDGNQINPFNMELNIKNRQSTSRAMLDKYLNFLELNITDDPE